MCHLTLFARLVHKTDLTALRDCRKEVVLGPAYLWVSARCLPPNATYQRSAPTYCPCSTRRPSRSLTKGDN